MRLANGNFEKVELLMSSIERNASVKAWLYGYELLAMDRVPDNIPDDIEGVLDRYLLEKLRKAIAQ